MDAKFCCACFESKINLLSCFDEKSPGITIASIINQHLDFKITKNDANLPKHVCGECWIKILNFHNFYQSVKDAKEIFLKGTGIAIIGPKKFHNKNASQSETNQRFFKSDEFYTDEEFLQNDDYPDVDTFEYVYVKSESNDQYTNENEKDISNEFMIEIQEDNKSKIDECKRRYECDICGRTYPKMSSLREHILSIHVGQETECELCKAKLKSEAQLKKHMKNIHSGIIFMCEQCPKQFKTREAMNRHKHTHTNEPFPQIVCPECGIMMDNVKYKGHKSLHKRQKERAARPKESLDDVTIDIPEDLLKNDPEAISFVVQEQVFRIIQKRDAKRKRSVCETGWADDLKDAICRYSTLPCVFSFRTAIAGSRIVKCKGECRECKSIIFAWSMRHKITETNIKVFNFDSNTEHKKKYIRMKTGRSEIIQRLMNNESASSIRKSLKTQMAIGNGREPPTLISANALRVLKHRLIKKDQDQQGTQDDGDESHELMDVVDE